MTDTDAARPALWTYGTLCRELGVDPEERRSAGDARIEDVGIDPAEARPGYLFIPTRSAAGQIAPVEAAIAHGAAALTSAPLSEFAADAPVIRVQNTIKALSTLAAAGRERCSGDFVAVTGSVGKSTVHAMALEMLSAAGRTHGRLGNFNLELGVKRVLAATPPDTRFSVYEVASIGPGTLAPSATAVRPTVGVVTAARESHATKFAGLEALIREKTLLLDHLTGSSVAIVSRRLLEADEGGQRLIAGKPVGRLMTVGTTREDTVRLLDVRLSRTRTVADVEIEGTTYHVAVPLGRPFAENAAFAVAIAHAVGVDPEDAVSSLARFQPPLRRLQRLRIAVGGAETRIAELVDDSMNASPTSTRALLEVLKVRQPRRKVLVLGDMRELGPDEVEQHRALASDVRDAGVDVLVAVGPLAAALGRDLAGELDVLALADSVEAARQLPALVEHGDLVAVKGSAGIRLNVIAGALAGNSGPRTPAGDWTVEDEVPARGGAEAAGARRATARPRVPSAVPQVAPEAPAADDGPPVLWRYDELCRDLGVQPRPASSSAGAEITTVTTSANGAGPGTLFVPLVAPTAQPRSLALAFAAGATVALASVPVEQLAPDAPVIPVDHPVQALGRLSAVGRARCEGDVVAVAEADNRSSVKGLVIRALSTGAPVHTGAGSDEFQLRRILAITPPGTRNIVVGVTTLPPAGMGRRSAIVRPTVAMLPAGSAAASALPLLDQLTGRSVAIVGREVVDDDEAMARCRAAATRVLTVGTGPRDDVRLSAVQLLPERSIVRVEVEGTTVELALAPGDRRLIADAVHALAVAHALGRDASEAAAALQGSHGGRALLWRQRVDVRGSGTIVEVMEDALSRTRPSLRALLAALEQRPNARRRLLVLADPPDDRDAPRQRSLTDDVLGRSLADELGAARLDLIVTIGTEARRLAAEVDGGTEVAAFETPEEAAHALLDLIGHGDLIAMASSGGMQLRPLWTALVTEPAQRKISFDWRVEWEAAQPK